LSGPDALNRDRPDLPLPRRGALNGKSARTCRRWRLFSCVLVLACLLAAKKRNLFARLCTVPLKPSLRSAAGAHKGVPRVQFLRGLIPRRLRRGCSFKLALFFAH
jgi:hypothetical protein